jgi:hypothetical protein
MVASWLVTMVATATLAACDAGTFGAPPSAITAPNDHLIVPGQRVGPFVLGMTEADLLKLGKPSNRTGGYLPHFDNDRKLVGSSPISRYCYTGDACVDVDQSSHLVVLIDTGYNGDSFGYHTSDNLGVGSSYQNVIGSLLWGTPDPRLTTYNDFSRRLLEIGFTNEQTGAHTNLRFSNQGSSMADPSFDDVRWLSMSVKPF